MRIPRFFAPHIPAAGSELSLELTESRHAVRVLRLQEGSTIAVLDGVGTLAEAAVVHIGTGRREMVVCCVGKRDLLPLPALRICLYVAPPRGKLMGQIVRMATELGVWRIVPTLCRFGVACPERRSENENWRGDAIAAVKQSGNLFLPEISPPRFFADAIALAPEHGYFGAIPSRTDVPDCRTVPDKGEVALWIGPEGGFAPEELQALREALCVPLAVGNWTLRVETAVPALLGSLLERIGHDNLCRRHH